MPQPTIIVGDCQITGKLLMGSIQLPNGGVVPSNIAAGTPGNYIPASTTRQKHKLVFAQDSTAVVATETKPIAIIVGATATVITAQAALIAPCVGAATVTVDFKINGVSLLVSPISLTSTNTARQIVVSAIASAQAALVAGAIIEVFVTATVSTGTLGSGLVAVLQVDEDPL